MPIGSFPRHGARPRRLSKRRKATGSKPSPRQPGRFPASTKSMKQYKKAPEVTREKLLSRDYGTCARRHGQDHSRSERWARPGGRSLFAAWAFDAAGGRRRPQVKGAGGQRRREDGEGGIAGGVVTLLKV